jgi:methylphosphotriester-DNA--protein-cysteine methyltransferase
MYREYRPPPDLAQVVECVWEHDVPPGEPDPSGAILPDGRVDLVWSAGGGALIAGPQRQSVPRPLTAPFTTVGLRFRPGAGPPLLRLPAHELVDRHVALAEVDTRVAAALERSLAGAERAEEARAVLLEAVRAFAERAPVDPLVTAAGRLLERPDASVAGVAAAVSLSDRQLLRRFRDSVGYGPKTLQRVLRFRRLVHELPAADDLAWTAAVAGYADQAHMTREVRALTGETPAELARRWREADPG